MHNEITKISKHITDWFGGNPYLNFLFLFLAITSVAISIYLYFKSKREKIPRYIDRSFAIIENSISAIEGLEVKHNNTNIKQLTLSRVSFWNGGKKTIDGNDLAKADRLRISFENDTEIISAKIIHKKRDANAIKIDKEKNIAFISFDFLDYSDGAIFEIYHTGAAHDKASIKGTIKGSRHITYGEHKKDYLIDITIYRIATQLQKIGVRDGSLLEKIIILLLVPVLFPIFGFSIIFDKFASFSKKIPSEYQLSEEKKHNNTHQQIP